MATKLLTPRKQSTAVPAIATSPTLILPDGRELTAGMVLTVTGVEGVFKFKYARLGEVTCYGGAIAGEKSDHAWRTFRPAQIAAAGANLTTVALEAKATAIMPTEFSLMTAGQKAAHTKRMNAAKAAQAAGVA